MFNEDNTIKAILLLSKLQIQVSLVLLRTKYKKIILDNLGGSN